MEWIGNDQDLAFCGAGRREVPLPAHQAPMGLERQGNINIRAGDTIFVEGGPGSGKSKFVEQNEEIFWIWNRFPMFCWMPINRSQVLAEFAAVLPTKSQSGKEARSRHRALSA